MFISNQFCAETLTRGPRSGQDTITIATAACLSAGPCTIAGPGHSGRGLGTQGHCLSADPCQDHLIYIGDVFCGLADTLTRGPRGPSLIGPVLASGGGGGGEEEDGLELECESEGEVRERTQGILRKLQNPTKPKPEEVSEHELTHCPYRSWCSTCVKGRGKRLAHRKHVHVPGAAPAIHIDYCFLRGAMAREEEEDDEEEKETKTLTVLCACDRESGMTMATVVPRKGVTGSYPAKRLYMFIKELGFDSSEVTLILRSDQEPAIQALVDDLRLLRTSGRTLVEMSPVGSSQSNGAIERHIQSIEGLSRTLKLSLEKRWGVHINHTHPCIPWLLEHASLVLNRCQMGHDGKTAHQRWSGRKGQLLGAEFGEAILYRGDKVASRFAKLDSLWSEGVFIGIRGPTGEATIATASGIAKARSIRRRPLDERWQSCNADLITFLPWKSDITDEDFEGFSAPFVIGAPMTHEEKEEIEKEKHDVLEQAPRRLYVTRKDVNDTTFGYTAGCIGCRAILSKGPKQTHSDACRKRLEGYLGSADPRVKASRDRYDTFCDKAIKADAKRRRSDDAAVSPSPDAAGPSSSHEVGQKRDGDTLDREVSEKHRRIDAIITQWASEDGGRCAWDDVRDVPLVLAKVEEARLEEMNFMVEQDVYTIVPIQEAWDATGKPPISVRWIDTDKGREGEEKYRSRLVARDFRIKGDDRDDTFASMPPLEAQRLLFAITARKWREWEQGQGEHWKLAFIDIKKAHLTAPCKEPSFVELPSEDTRAVAGTCGRLNRWLYGMRGAAHGWELHYQAMMRTIGFRVGDSNSAILRHPGRDITCVIHGDDFVFGGTACNLHWVTQHMESWFSLVVRGILGPEGEDIKSIDVLNRRVTWDHRGLAIQADSALVEKYLALVGVATSSRGREHPGENEDPTPGAAALGTAEAKMYRAAAATANYIAADRPDIAYATKEACRRMSRPTAEDWDRLVKLGTYLARYRAGVAMFSGWKCRTDIATFADSDWAGCKESRRSTSGGTLTYLGSLMKSWSSMQTTIALSSAEAELHAVIRGATESLGFQSLLRDFGIHDVRITVFTDATAAAAIVKRKGLGRLRHLDVRDLWIQEKVASKIIKVERVKGGVNPADPLTKFVGGRQAFNVLGPIGFLQASTATADYAPTRADADGATFDEQCLRAYTAQAAIPDDEEDPGLEWEAYLNCMEIICCNAACTDICIENDSVCLNLPVGVVKSPSADEEIEPYFGTDSNIGSASPCTKGDLYSCSLDRPVFPDPGICVILDPQVCDVLNPHVCDEIVEQVFVDFRTAHIPQNNWADMCEESNAQFAADLFVAPFPSDMRKAQCRRGGV
jgi:hypothetical protein